MAPEHELKIALAIAAALTVIGCIAGVLGLFAVADIPKWLGIVALVGALLSTLAGLRLVRIIRYRRSRMARLPGTE